MQAILIALFGKVVEIALKYLIAWGERSIAAQKEIKRKMEEHKANIEAAKKKTEAYEENPTDSNRDNVP